MLSLAGPFLAITALLTMGGLLKVIRPVDTATALAAVGVPARSGLVRLLGLVEMAIGMAAIISGQPLTATLTALAYLGFAGFVLVARRAKTPIQSCGCFGKTDTPPSPAHIFVNLGAATIATVVALRPLPRIDQLLAGQPGGGIPLVLLTAVTVYLLFLILTALPQTLAATDAA